MLNYYVGLAAYSNGDNDDVSIHMTYKPLKAPYPIGTYFESTIILNDNGVYVFNSNSKSTTLYDKNSEALITSCRELVKTIKSEYEHQGKEMVDTPNNDSILVNSHCIEIKSPELQSCYVYANNRIIDAIKNADPIKQNKENTIEKPVTPRKPIIKQTIVNNVIDDLKTTGFFEEPVLYQNGVANDYFFPSTQAITVNVIYLPKIENDMPWVKVTCYDIMKRDQQQHLKKIINIVNKYNCNVE